MFQLWFFVVHIVFQFTLFCYSKKNSNESDNKIDKVLIVETKGKGFKEQTEFIDRRNYIEKEFIKFNNKKFGYNKFDYLYIEDALTENEILSKDCTHEYEEGYCIYCYKEENK